MSYHLGMLMLDLTALHNKINVFSNDTFLVTNQIELKYQEKIAAAYPSIPFNELTKKENENKENLTYKFESFCAESLDRIYLKNSGFNDLFINLIHLVTEKKYIVALSEATNMDLVDKKIIIEFARYRPGDWLDAHYDKQAHKVLSQIFYFNISWDARWGGYFDVLHPSDISKTILSIPPLINYSIIVKANPKAWHKVTPLHSSALVNRVNMVVQFYTE